MQAETSRHLTVLVLLGRCLALLAAVLLVGNRGTGNGGGVALAGEIGFVERFALAEDREAMLSELIPGTDEHYFYSCLHYQNEGDLDRVDGLIESWTARGGMRSGMFEEIRMRQAILTYDRDPKATIEYLRRNAGIGFGDQREVVGATSSLPTSLAPELLDVESWTQSALAHYPGSSSGFHPAAFRRLAARKLSDDQLHHLLTRLRHPDIRGLAQLIDRDLDHKNTAGFGSLEIHKWLLRSQLDELLEMRPALIGDSDFVGAYLERLQPGPDEAWQWDARAREAHLNRLWSFVSRLAPAYHPLRSNVLYHRLAHDRARGVYDRERFLAYLTLPRRVPYTNPDYLKRRDVRGAAFDIGRGGATQLPVVRDDRELVEDYFLHFFTTDASYDAYSEYVRDDFLRRLFVEAKVLHGIGDPERWYTLLDNPTAFEALRDRVEIRFAPTQQTYFAGDDRVKLEVDMKNVGKLIVKVFEMDTFNYYRANMKTIDASIELDGLVPTEELAFEYDDPSTRRLRRSFELPSLDGSGVYIIDLIGNGINSRAVIHKGGLRYVERLTDAGHMFRILDERNQPVPDATIWLDGHEYAAIDGGEIPVPYSSRPQRQQILLRHGDFSSLASFGHRGESYALEAGFFVDRESLRAGGEASVLVRPALSVNDVPVATELLEDTKLVLIFTDMDGIDISEEIPDFELHADRESVHTFRVPERVQSMRVHLEASVKSLSKNEDVRLRSTEMRLELNRIDREAWTACPYFGRTVSGSFIDVLGKNGEPRARVPVRVSVYHRDFKDPVRASLQTDARGRVDLGTLDDIVAIDAVTPQGTFQWRLDRELRTMPRRLTGKVGETLRVPFTGDRESVSLLEKRDAVYLADMSKHLRVRDGFVEARNLEAGDYELRLGDEVVDVYISSGIERDGWLLAQQRFLETPAGDALQITNLRRDGTRLAIQLANVTAATRLHLVATRFDAAYSPYRRMTVPAGPELDYRLVAPTASDFQSGRSISDEYRYILERKYATKYPGNMLQRPRLLLNPWARDEAGSIIGVGGGGGGAFGGRSGGARKRAGRSQDEDADAVGHGSAVWANLDFLSSGSVLLANERPDENGAVEVELSGLGDQQQVHVLAIDGTSTILRSVPLPAVALASRDRRLDDGLSPDRHAIIRKRIDVVVAGETVTIADPAGAEAELYQTLGQVYELFATLNPSEKLRTFRFLIDWPSLSSDRKRELLSKHGCHELHLFLQRRDPEFFEAVVRPHLASKMEKTFIDHYLLDDDLSGYLRPWAYDRLNLVERILLGIRVEGRAASTARIMRDRLDLVQRNPEELNRLFEAAVRLSAYDAPIDGSADWLLGNKKKDVEASRELLGVENLEEVEAEYADDKMPAAASPAEEPALQRLRFKEEGKASGVAGGGPVVGRRAERDALADDRRFYQRPASTKELVESQYYRLPAAAAGPDLVPMNALWLDLARSGGARPFVSANFAEATRATEMLLALALLDLPFAAGEHTSTRDGGRVTLRAATPFVLFRSEVQSAEDVAADSGILVRQNFYELENRYRFENNERFDKFVRDEFVAGEVYGCQVVLTNPTSSPRKLELLLQIPMGAIPIKGGFDTKTRYLSLGAFATTTLEYHFYFPATGEYAQFPVHVAQEGEVVGYAEPMRFRVVAEPSRIDTDSWDHISQNGSSEQVMAYLEENNILRIDLDRIAWRMRDATFYHSVLELLRDRHVYRSKLWSYSLFQRDLAGMREYIEQTEPIVARCGFGIDSTLLRLDAEERGWIEHLEYEPLHNARAHQFGASRTIQNDRISSTYDRFLQTLTYQPRLDDEDWLRATYYFMLQDRVEEGLAAFARIDRDRIDTKLQYDYMTAYVDFFRDAGAAREIASLYADYPVDRWRKEFREVITQLDEIEGKGERRDPADEGADTERLAGSEPTLTLAVEARKIDIGHTNLDSCTVRYYPMDIEHLFSVSPFVKQDAGAFSFIRPGRADEVELAVDQAATSFDLPEEFRSANVIVEVRAGGLSRSKTYYSHDLDVRWMENYGQLQVRHRDSGRALPRTYVKVYARTGSGDVKFYKDGYTDLRGRFDYVALSNDELTQVERFAILVLSPDDGAIVHEVAPPKE